MRGFKTPELTNAAGIPKMQQFATDAASIPRMQAVPVTTAQNRQSVETTSPKAVVAAVPKVETKNPS